MIEGLPLTSEMHKMGRAAARPFLFVAVRKACDSEQGHSLRRRMNSLPGRKNSLRRQKKFPAPTGENICEVTFNALELQRELTPSVAELAGNLKKSLPNSLHQGIRRPRADPVYPFTSGYPGINS